MPRTTMKWVDIDPSKLSAKQANAYRAWQEGNTQEQQTWAAFESSMQTGVPSSKTLRVSTKFGRLQVALANKQDKESAKTRSNAQSLSDFLAQISDEE